MAAARELVALYREREKRTKHNFCWEDDYITTPKRATGYRSHHLIYEFGSDADNKQCFRGHRIEIQVRSQLQHAWATAVETVDYFTGQRLKSNAGQEPWKRFFKLMSGAFALREGTPPVSGAPDPAILIGKLAKAEQAVQARETLKGFKVAAQWFGQTRPKDAALFLLELDTGERTLSITPYTRARQHIAAAHRLDLEKQFLGNDSMQIVVVEVGNLKDLERAYPNYHADLDVFLEELDDVLGE